MPLATRSTRVPVSRALPAFALAAGLLVTPAAAVAAPPTATATGAPPSSVERASRDGDRRAGKTASEQSKRPARQGFRIATLNLNHELSPRQVRADIRAMIDTRHPTVIGFQERRDTRSMMRAALPEHWALRMPVTADGTDDNPIAFDTRVWTSKFSWPRLLAGKTWRRNSGQTAINQYGVVTVLEHRKTGHRIRAISFHMPNLIHNRSTGGPNYGEPQRLGAFWRMAASVREVGQQTPKDQQFVALCDCNVTESKDSSDKLVRGKITRPLGLENNYSAAGYKLGWRIDYVMSERSARYRIASWKVMHRLHTDHPGVVTRFAPQRARRH